jgi:hypothetical protein
VDHAVEHHAPVVFMEDLVTKCWTHTLLDNHIAGDLCGLAQVAAGTGRDAVSAVLDLLGDAATEGTCQDIFEFDD